MALTKQQETIIKKWVAALRSGKYKQGKERLHKKNERGQNRFCCLGVLCDLAVKAKVIPAPVPHNKTFFYEKSNAYLPEKVRQWSGIKSHDGGFQHDSLSELNDDGRKFTTIAKIIESKPEGLFV